jgi:AhpD family alkylhydroperoxidase
MKNKYPWYIRLLIRLQQRTYGEPLGPTLYWGRLKSTYLYFLLLFRGIKKSRSQVPEVLQALVQALVSKINHCSFCIDFNSYLALQAGNLKEKVVALENFQESDLFNSMERVTLEYAQAVTFNEKFDLKRLEEYFDKQTIIQLTALIAYQNMSSKFNSALGISAHGFCSS